MHQPSILPGDKVDLLIVAAHGPELRGLRTHLGERLDGAIRGLRITAKTVGIGMPVAGPSTAKRVFQLEPKAVIHLGTCGIFPGLEQYQPHDVIVGTQVTLVDHAVNAYRASFPEPMQTTLATHTMLSQGLAAYGPRTHMAGIGTTLALTIDDTLAAEVPQRANAHAESLEAFGIAHACTLAQTPYTCVLAASHVVGSRGREDWHRFERQSTIAAAEVLIAWLMAGAQGMPHARPA
jgi:nucleoside phosphorylase